MGKKIIFHHPLPLNSRATSASGIRPLKMLEAFKLLGYRVELVTGYSLERKKKIARLKYNINNGEVYDFVYSESSTMPTILTDTHHLPLRPFSDFNFFAFCKSKDIPIGLFYRDIYWAFDGYGHGLNKIKSFFAKACYKYDLKNYNKYLTKLYLPSIEMGKYIPIVNESIFSPLPPGHDVKEISRNVKYINSNCLKLFYVGGMSSHYQMQVLFEVVCKQPNVRLTICTRESEWLAVKDTYPVLTDNIKVVHKSGSEMQSLMQEADIVSLFVKPQEYREFAAPVKLYEYLGNNKPILASKGSLAGEFVENNRIGWSIEYKAEALVNFLSNLINDMSEIESIKNQMQVVANQHNWGARAQQVIADLSK